ncbi:hypothetical protein PSA7680_01115 [Pseudoruegeria aquimaris]|uniref:DUF4177 domain-containing protein n=1 Tax=Pseudoruegeria aquimaris TaxID=393663 RepID=A0A1Y5RV98_9RHOB|nr:DUF4177 domain-containing protein [Pseudoruegeria aquimaris]SLN25874.1 hypothetical protein PSA7680_01115 [Pseudoruegeria aquimaris]
MPKYEYKVVPAPQRGEKAKGLKTSGERFAHALMGLMNDLGRDGWEYLRADTLPCEERSGLTGKTTTYQNMLVFRREVAEVAPVEAPKAIAAPINPADTPANAPASPEPREEAGEATGEDTADTPPLAVQTPESLGASLTPKLAAVPDAAEGKAPKVGPAANDR